MKKTVLVGGTIGSLGRSIAERLMEHNHQVIESVTDSGLPYTNFMPGQETRAQRREQQRMMKKQVARMMKKGKPK